MTSFDEVYFLEKKKNIEQMLERILPKETEPPSILRRAMRYSVLAPGKRVRPILCVVACECVGGDESHALLPAVAIELFHTYTLIHDDLPCMDDDNFRRGQLSCHTVFGEAIAILAGDALQALTFELLAQAQNTSNSNKIGSFVKELAEIAGMRGVVGGQSLEIETDGKKMDLGTIERIHFGKTAALFKAAARIGAIAGSANQSQLDNLTCYAVNLGLAFQFIDDLIDAEKERKPTEPHSKARPEFNSVDFLGRKTVSARANHYTAQAETALAGFQGKDKQRLINFARWLLDRKS